MAEQTFETLNKDIDLIPMRYGKYDRNLVNSDWVQLSGEDSLRMAIQIKIMTIFNELKSNPTYFGFGNKAWLYVKDNNTLLNQVTIRDLTMTALKEIRRIKSVDVLTVANDITDPYSILINFAVTSISDQTVAGSVQV